MSKADLLGLKAANERLAWEEESRGSAYNRAMPVHLTLETTMQCNMRCIMCQVYRSPDAMRRGLVGDPVMPLDLFEKVAGEAFPSAKEMTPTVMGEPLLTPYLPRVLELLSAYAMKMNMVTNGMFLTRETSVRLMPHLAKIKVSCDGASKATFEAIRRGAKFETVMDNVRRFNAVREQLDLEEQPVLAFQVTLMRKNIEELPQIVELASELGVDLIIGLHVYVFDKAFENQSLLHHRELADAVIGAAEERAHDLGVATHFPAPFGGEGDGSDAGRAPGERPRLCKFLWRELWVSHTGDVTPCCVPDRPVMGSIRESSLAEIWNNELYREMRRRLGSEEPFECCRNCSLATQYEAGIEPGYDERRFFLYRG